MALTRDEARGALVLALEARPAGWVARELALTLARLEYRAGADAMARYTRAVDLPRGTLGAECPACHRLLGAGSFCECSRHERIMATESTDTALGSRRAPRVTS